MKKVLLIIGLSLLLAGSLAVAAIVSYGPQPLKNREVNSKPGTEDPVDDDSGDFVNPDNTDNSDELSKLDVVYETDESGGIIAVDAEEYLESVGDVLNREIASMSEKMLSEDDVIKFMEERGFYHSLQADYTDDGILTDTSEAEPGSKARHPIYDTYYKCKDDSLWEVSVINGDIFATPLSYNFQSGISIPLMVSETEYILSYDSQTDQFFEVKMNPALINIRVAERIDSELLEQLSETECAVK